jgi:Rrf2 family protein
LYGFVMRRSQKADYALRAALDLAIHASPAQLVRTAEIARRTGTPAKFLEAILGQLRRAGIAESQRGAGGGHRLARPPGRVTAGEVWRAVDGPLSLAGRPARRRVAADGPARAVHQLWVEVERAVVRTVDEVSLEDLARRSGEGSGTSDFVI